MKRTLIGCAIAALGLAFLQPQWLIGRQAVAQASRSLWAQIYNSGELVCGAMPSDHPGSWRVEGPARYEGYEINLCRQIAIGLSVAMKKQINLRLTETSWSTVVLDLQSGRIDLYPGMSATPQRRKALDMAGAMYELAECAVNRKGFSPGSRWADYDKPSVRLATVTGTSDEQAIRELAPDARDLSFREQSDAILAVQAGRADAFGTSVLTCLDILRANANVFGTIVFPTPVKSLPSFAGMRKDGDGRFHNWLQQWAAAARANGTVRWLFFDAMQKAGLNTSKLPDGFQL